VKRIVFLLFIISIVNFCFAQNDTIIIKKSTDKVIIGGQMYYVHIVKQGETLFSLSNAYEVSQKEIAKENPEIFLGLQIGQALKIPVHKESVSQNSSQDKYVIYHRVKKGETLYRLSQIYNVPKEEIIKFNDPSVEYVINVNQIIRIPKIKELNNVVDLTPKNENLDDTVRISDDFIYHKVIKDDTEYSLVRDYNISKKILHDHNTFLSDGLKLGQVLKIPKVKGEETTALLIRDDQLYQDSVLFDKRSTIAYSDSVGIQECEQEMFVQTEPFQVALLLPFYLDKNDEEFYVDSSEVDDFGKKIYEKIYYDPFYVYPRSVAFVEFYEGLLLSIDSLKQRGLSINLHVYDTQNDTARIKEILGFPEFANTDLIIGPIYNQEIILVSDFSKENGIKMILPLGDNLSLVDENPYLFQVYPSYNAQIEEFAKFVSEFGDKNIVLVHNGDSLGYSNVEMVKEKIFSYLSVDTLINNIQFKEVVFEDSIYVLEHALSDDLENVFIIPSNEEAFVTNVITKLNTINKFDKDVRVIGLSRWQRFRNIDPQYYFNLDLCIASPFFIDYHHKDVKDFVLKYRKTYNTEPKQMAIHAYDVGLYFFSALMNYGNNFDKCIYNHSIDLLQADYRFVKWYSTSGFENVNVDIIKYFEGYNIFRIDELEKYVVEKTEENE